METKNLRTLSSTTLCPVPVAGGQFSHSQTIYSIRVRATDANLRSAFMYIFAIFTKGTWTPAESNTGVEAALAAQNNSLYKVELLKAVPLIPSFGYAVPSTDATMNICEVHVTLDITALMNRIQSSVNSREGLINEEDAVPCHLGVAINAIDDGATYYIDSFLTDHRKLTKIPMKL
jgi:hypothetical protein